MSDLNNKVALITGSTSGIGKEIALCLAAAKCKIMLNGIEGPDVAALISKEMTAAGASGVSFSGANLIESGGAANLIAATEKQFGSIDILVNNAGIQHVEPIETFSDDNWDRIIELDLSAPFRLIKHALPIMRKNGWGRIINISSVHGLVASVNKAAYVSAKHGLIGLTKTVALETAPEPITCNAICPGFVHTPLVDLQIAAFAKSKGISPQESIPAFIREKQPSQAFVSPSDIGAMIALLCSSAGAQITGSSFTMDGGWTAQ